MALGSQRTGLDHGTSSPISYRVREQPLGTAPGSWTWSKTDRQRDETSSIGPIPQIFVQIPNNWDVFEHTHYRQPQSMLQPDCRTSISHPRPTITAWCSSACTSGIKSRDPMELLNETSHCFHMHKKYLSDLFGREADIPQRPFSIRALPYGRVTTGLRGAAHTFPHRSHLPLGVCQEDIHRATDRSRHTGPTWDCFQSLVR